MNMKRKTTICLEKWSFKVYHFSRALYKRRVLSISLEQLAKLNCLLKGCVYDEESDHKLKDHYSMCQFNARGGFLKLNRSANRLKCM